MDEVLANVLRVAPEPCAHLDDSSIHDRLVAAPAEYLAFLESALTELADGTAELELPPKALFTDPEGDFRVMPCVVRIKGRTWKTVKIVGTNKRQAVVPDQITVGKAFRLDPVENFISHSFDACLLSSARTAACAALAVKHLSKARNKIVVTGAGRVGFYAGLYLAALGGVDEIVFHDLAPERARRVSAALERGESDGVAFREAEPGDLRSAGVIVLATSAEHPICSPSEVTADLVVSVGADTEDQRELDDSWPAVADVYVDTVDCELVGDVRAWRRLGSLKGKGEVDLLTLFRDGVASWERRRVFVSSGSALFDNLTIAYLLDRSTD